MLFYRKLIIGLFFIVFQITPVFARVTCEQISNSLNKKLPMQIDSASIARATYCSSSSNGKSNLNYQMELSSSIRNFDSLSGELKQGQINYWCSQQDMVYLLSMFNIRYEYFDSLNKYLGFTSLNSKDCLR